jgi:hypothetical protein
MNALGYMTNVVMPTDDIFFKLPILINPIPRRRKYYSSAKAVDGLSKTFSMTNKVRRVNPYWYVDLGGIYMIRHIESSLLQCSYTKPATHK